MTAPANLVIALLNFQTVAIAVNTPNCFMAYRSGVLTESQCTCATSNAQGPIITHAVTIVGYSLNS